MLISYIYIFFISSHPHLKINFTFMYNVYIASGVAGTEQLSKQTVVSKTRNDAGRNICSLMFDEASKNDKIV